MYNDDCLPDASVNDPCRADLVASSEMSARLSSCDMRDDPEKVEAVPLVPRAIK
jgi:hypothetical protein